MLYRICVFTLIFAFTGISAFSTPIITEFIAKNELILTDEDGDYSDWIEVYNSGAVAANFEGWTLSDKADQPRMRSFPLAVLQPDECLVVFASNKDRRIPGHRIPLAVRVEGVSGFRLADGSLVWVGSFEDIEKVSIMSVV